MPVAVAGAYTVWRIYQWLDYAHLFPGRGERIGGALPSVWIVNLPCRLCGKGRKLFLEISEDDDEKTIEAGCVARGEDGIPDLRNEECMMVDMNGLYFLCFYVEESKSSPVCNLELFDRVKVLE